MRKSLLGIFLMITLAGCTYPNTTVSVKDERPSIAIQGAGATAILVVDGVEMGRANKYDGRRNVLLLEPGTHRVEIRERDSVVYSEVIFLGRGELKTLSIGHPGERR